MRHEKSKPVLDAMEPWLRDKLLMISQKTKLAEAIRMHYRTGGSLSLRGRRPHRTRLEHRRALDQSHRSHPKERTLFAGLDGGAETWAIVASLIECCKLADVEPYAYLADIMTRIVNGHLNSQLDELSPWAYQTPQPAIDVV